VTTPFEALATPPGFVPRDGVAGAEGIMALCDALKASRAALAERDAAELADALGRIGERFLDPGDPLRREALALLPASSGLSAEMATEVLDGMAADWTGPRLGALLESELGDATVLDAFVRRQGDASVPGSRVMAVGPSLCVQIVAGSVPGVGVTALLRSLLVKGPTLLKPGRGDTVLPRLFARGLAEADRALAAALAVVYWRGGNPALESAALAFADVVTAYGSDGTVADLRSRAPVTARFVPYHHRVSVGVVGREALTDAAAPRTAADVARAVALFDQRGCVSPQLLYVEEGGECSCAGFAEALGVALSDLERTLPTGPLDGAAASALHQARGVAELTAGSEGSHARSRIIHGGAAPWTVLLETSPEGAPGRFPPVGRVARVRPVARLDALPALLAPLSPHLQTVGVAGLGARLDDFARALGQLGAVRVAPFSAVPFPPPWWHHDGGGPLRDLLRFVDLEA